MGDTELTARAANVLNSVAKVQQNFETTKDLAKKARPLSKRMANADTLNGADAYSGNALDAAKLQNNSETTKDLAKKNCLLSYHSALIAGASARQLKQSWHRVPSIRKINQLSCQVGSKWWIVTQAFRLQRYKENMKYRHIL